MFKIISYNNKTTSVNDAADLITLKSCLSIPSLRMSYGNDYTKKSVSWSDKDGVSPISSAKIFSSETLDLAVYDACQYNYGYALDTSVTDDYGFFATEGVVCDDEPVGVSTITIPIKKEIGGLSQSETSQIESLLHSFYLSKLYLKYPDYKKTSLYFSCAGKQYLEEHRDKALDDLKNTALKGLDETIKNDIIKQVMIDVLEDTMGVGINNLSLKNVSNILNYLKMISCSIFLHLKNNNNVDTILTDVRNRTKHFLLEN
jgi:hypothetical protein